MSKWKWNGTILNSGDIAYFLKYHTKENYLGIKSGVITRTCKEKKGAYGKLECRRYYEMTC